MQAIKRQVTKRQAKDKPREQQTQDRLKYTGADQLTKHRCTQKTERKKQRQEVQNKT